MHIYTHFLFCYFIFLLQSKQCVFCLPLAKRESSTQNWQIQTNIAHLQEYNNESFKNNESALLDSLSKLLSNKLNNIISKKGNFSAVLNSDKNTTQGTIYRRCDRYEGNLKNGVKDGYGIMYYADGAKYIGYWANDTCNGHGIFTLPNGDRYEGSYKNGCRHGKGTHYTSNIMYWGKLIANLMTDEGEVTCLNYSLDEEPLINNHINVNYSDYNTFFNKYVGEWVDDRHHGHGTLEWAHGGRYEGSFINGTMNGYGLYYYIDGSTYEGQWADGSINGQGVCKWKTGDLFKGTFKNNNINGNGTYYLANGTKYVCEWVDNKPSGHCVITWSNGDRFEGNMRYEILYGNNTYYYADGSKYMLNEINGTFIVPGVLLRANGSRYKGPQLDTKLRAMQMNIV